LNTKSTNPYSLRESLGEIISDASERISSCGPLTSNEVWVHGIQIDTSENSELSAVSKEMSRLFESS